MEKQNNQDDFIWDSESQMLWRSNMLFELGVRLEMLIKAHGEKHANAPQYEEAKELAEELSKQARDICDKEEQEKIYESSPIKERLERNGFNDVEKLMANLEYILYHENIYKPESLNNLQFWCHTLSLFYVDVHKECNNKNYDILYSLNILDDRISRKANEAIGYWTPKLKERYDGDKGNKTIKQMKQKKIDAVRKAYIKFINSHNNPTAKKALSDLSKQKMAKQVREIAIDDLKSQNITKLSVDTVIEYLDQQDFKYWKKKTPNKN